MLLSATRYTFGTIYAAAYEGIYIISRLSETKTYRILQSKIYRMNASSYIAKITNTAVPIKFDTAVFYCYNCELRITNCELKNNLFTCPCRLIDCTEDFDHINTLLRLEDRLCTFDNNVVEVTEVIHMAVLFVDI